MRGKKQCIFYLEMCGPDFSAAQSDSIFALFSLNQRREARALRGGMRLQKTGRALTNHATFIRAA